MLTLICNPPSVWLITEDISEERHLGICSFLGSLTGGGGLMGRALGQVETTGVTALNRQETGVLF